jgi:truncated hemoglobin YjbI
MAKKLGIGCLILVILSGIGGVVLVKKLPDLIQSGGAALVVKGFEATLKGAGLPEDEQEAIMVPVKELMADFKSNELSMEELGKVMSVVVDSHVPRMVMMRGFELMYVEDSELSEEAKQGAKKTVSRYLRAMMTDKISHEGEHEEKISDIVTTETTNEKGETVNELKEDLTKEELDQCLEIMKNKADEAGIEDRMFSIDIASALQDAIAEARKAHAEDASGKVDSDAAGATTE